MVSPRLVRISGWVSVALGLWGLFCWVGNWPTLGALHSRYIPFSPQAAAGVCVAGLALIVQSHPVKSAWHQRFILGLVLTIIFIGVTSLWDGVRRFDVDPARFRFVPPGRYADHLTLRISWPFAATLMLFGLGLWFSSCWRERCWTKLAGIAGLVVAGTGATILLGYSYNTPLLYGGVVRPVSILAAVALVSLGTGLLGASASDRFPANLVCGPTIRAWLLRRLLPLTLLIAYLNQLLDSWFPGYMSLNPALRDALLAMGSIAVAAVVISFAVSLFGRRLDEAEAERSEAQAALEEARDQLEARVRDRTAELHEVNAELREEIARRGEVEKTLRESQARLLMALEIGGMVNWEWDVPTGRVRYFENMAAVTRGDDVERYSALDSLMLEIHPEDRQRLAEALERTARESAPFQCEYRARMLDGAYRWILGKGRVVNTEDSKPRLVQGISRDITERKESEDRLRVLSQAVEQSTAAVIISDPRGNIEHVNARFTQVTGYSLDEVRGKNPRILKSGETLDEEYARLWRTITTGREWHGQFHNRKKNGELFWESASISPLLDQAGRITHFVAIKEDITERKRSETLLRESERKFRLIAESTAEVIFAFDMDRRPLYANPAVKALTGYTFEEVRQRGFINWIHPDDQPRMLALWEGLFAGKGYSNVEFRLVTKTGEIKWCSSTWGPTLDEQNRQIGVQGREVDITERRNLEGKLLEISAKERRRLGHDLHDGLGQYLAGVALKMKTLEEDLAAAGSRECERAREAVRLLNDAIRQSRELAHSLDPIHVQANGLVAALGSLAAHTRDMFFVQCRFACAQERVQVSNEAALALYRIAQEAIHNAIRHGGARRIDLELTVSPQQLTLSVHDDGRGFDPERKEDEGLGLHTMRYRANSVAGTLTVRSSSGKQGTCVECTVPVEAWQTQARDRPSSGSV